MVHRGRLARGRARRGCGVLPPGAAAPPGGCGAAVSPAGLSPPMGWGGGGVGVPWSPDAAPRRPQGGGLVVLAKGGQPPTGGVHVSPASLYPLGAGPSHGPPAPLAVAARCRLARGGGGKGPVSAGGGGLGQWSAVSGLRGSGPPLTLVAPVLPPTRAVPWEGRGSGGPAPPGGTSRVTVPLPSLPAHRLGRRGAAVTCAVVCVGAGAGAVAGSAGGSASGLGRCAKPGGARCWRPHP